MKFPNKADYLNDLEGYLDEVVTSCLTIHKELVNDNMMIITSGKMTSEQQKQYFIGKQLFSDEPVYKLFRLIANYRKDEYKDERENILFEIGHEVDKAKSYVKAVTKKDYDLELRLMADAMVLAGRKPSDIAKELCDTGWYPYERLDSLERNIHRWIKND